MTVESVNITNHCSSTSVSVSFEGECVVVHVVKSSLTMSIVPLDPERVSSISCPSSGSSDTLEVVWSPPSGQPVLSYRVEVREYVFMNNIVSTVFRSGREVLPTSLTVNELGESLLLVAANTLYQPPALLGGH